MPRADRLFALVQLLSGARYYSLAELTSTLETSARTVYRDLCDLEGRGLPIERVDGAYRVVPAATIRPLPLTFAERALLTITLANPAFDRHATFGPALSGLRAKLTAAFSGPDPVAQLAGPDQSGKIGSEVALALEEAIRNRHSISMLYTSLSGRQKRWRGLDPWLMIYRCAAWYIVGRCHVHDEPRTFRLDRIAGVLPIGSSFVRPEDFDAGEWFAHSWGVEAGEAAREAVIVFDRTVAPLIEHGRHHPTETMSRLEDGSIEYRLTVGPLEEIARWIAGFGGAARAIAPAALVDRVQAIAAGAVAAHRTTTRAAAMTRRSSAPRKKRMKVLDRTDGF
jgi:predicted DNA-binding transcriptional regulator YafY